MSRPASSPSKKASAPSGSVSLNNTLLYYVRFSKGADLIESPFPAALTDGTALSVYRTQSPKSGLHVRPIHHSSKPVTKLSSRCGALFAERTKPRFISWSEKRSTIHPKKALERFSPDMKVSTALLHWTSLDLPAASEEANQLIQSDYDTKSQLKEHLYVDFAVSRQDYLTRLPKPPDGYYKKVPYTFDMTDYRKGIEKKWGHWVVEEPSSITQPTDGSLIIPISSPSTNQQGIIVFTSDQGD